MGYGGCEPRIKAKYCTLYIKVLYMYNINDNKKIQGEGQYMNPKHSPYLKK